MWREPGNGEAPRGSPQGCPHLSHSPVEEQPVGSGLRARTRRTRAEATVSARPGGDAWGGRGWRRGGRPPGSGARRRAGLFPGTCCVQHGGPCSGRWVEGPVGGRNVGNLGRWPGDMEASPGTERRRG